MYEVTLTDATREAEMIRIVGADMPPSARTKIRAARTANQKNVTIGRMIRYSMM